MLVTMRSESCDDESGKTMSYNLKIVFVIVSVLFFCTQCTSDKNVNCEKISACKCVLSDGIGVNLIPLSEEITWLETTLNNISFFFHPCSNIAYGSHTGSDDCMSGSSICSFNKTSGKFKNLGNAEEVSFLLSDIKDYPVIRYVHKNITTAIQLLCVYSKTNTFTALDIHSEGVTHQLMLETRWACPTVVPVETKTASQTTDDTLSTGSVLVIIFFVFTTLYFVGGAIALKLIRGAEGKEMIPNYDFWVDLPNLMRDGLNFVVTGCQTNPSYDRI